MASFETRGFPIEYEVHGEAGRTPLVMIMGLGGTMRGWLVVTVPALQERRRCVVFDNRATGRSGDPGGPFSTRDMVGDTVALMDHLQIPEAHVLGGFLGGAVAQEFAIEHPERVASLVLAGTFARADAMLRMQLELWRDMVEAGVSPEIRIRNRLCWTVGAATLEHRELVEAMWRFYLQDEVPMLEGAFVRQAQACLDHDSLDQLDQVRCPTLLICGGNDVLTPPALHREMAGRIPNSRLVEIPGYGHLIAAEVSGRFNALVNRWLDEQDARNP